MLIIVSSNKLSWKDNNNNNNTNNNNRIENEEKIDAQLICFFLEPHLQQTWQKIVMAGQAKLKTVHALKTGSPSLSRAMQAKNGAAR